MFLAAFSSRSNIRPQEGQTWVRTERLFSTCSPHLLQSWLVYAGGTATTRRPAHAALPSRMVRNWAHPASWIDLLRPALLLAPLGRYPPEPSGLGAGRRLMLATW